MLPERVGGDARSAAGLFDQLSDATRIGIVTALFRQWERCPEDPCLTFSQLYERVDIDDSGRFNYHLKRLRDELVERREDGYTLTPLGIYLAPLVVKRLVPR